MDIGGFTIPLTFDIFTVLAWGLAIVALASIVSGVVGLARERRIHLGRLGGGLVLLVIGLLAFAIAGWAQTYRALTHNELVAYVRAVPVEGQSQAMNVTYTPVHQGQPGASRTFLLRGDEWQLGGDIIKWQDYINLLGVDTGYRITRLMGYYTDANDYQTKPITAYDLQDTTNSVYSWLSEHHSLVPFVRAVYGNDVRTVPSATATYNICVSTSGYWATPSPC